MGQNSSKKALKEVLSDRQAASTNEKLMLAFKGYDTNGDGKLDKSEFCSKFVKDLFKTLKDSFDIDMVDVVLTEDDWKGGEALSKAEIEQKTKEWVDREFDAMDKDGNGEISFEEFEQFIWQTYTLTKGDGATTSKYKGIHNAKK